MGDIGAVDLETKNTYIYLDNELHRISYNNDEKEVAYVICLTRPPKWVRDILAEEGVKTWHPMETKNEAKVYELIGKSMKKYTMDQTANIICWRVLSAFVFLVLGFGIGITAYFLGFL